MATTSDAARVKQKSQLIKRMQLLAEARPQTRSNNTRQTPESGVASPVIDALKQEIRDLKISLKVEREVRLAAEEDAKAKETALARQVGDGFDMLRKTFVGAFVKLSAEIADIKHELATKTQDTAASHAELARLKEGCQEQVDFFYSFLDNWSEPDCDESVDEVVESASSLDRFVAAEEVAEADKENAKVGRKVKQFPHFDHWTDSPTTKAVKDV